ncbi:right-handed parallel beta-helix repeat-containing protein [Candidatus Micrarchaeota archaeon]|nr:right-handed parallel beta-helix repeat-containing protein [Candidatus Micrarchaeota archaeon]MBU1886462.1 right-handed parallel beta-helix repeat-containing protein [Candidatus Micrarchaeota archaeon]
MGYLQDQNDDLVFITELVDDETGFNGSVFDFQIILPIMESALQNTYYVTIDDAIECVPENISDIPEDLDNNKDNKKSKLSIDETSKIEDFETPKPPGGLENITNCTVELDCADWGPCINGHQYQSCYDLANCSDMEFYRLRGCIIWPQNITEIISTISNIVPSPVLLLRDIPNKADENELCISALVILLLVLAVVYLRTKFYKNYLHWIENSKVFKNHQQSYQWKDKLLNMIKKYTSKTKKPPKMVFLFFIFNIAQLVTIDHVDDLNSDFSNMILEIVTENASYQASFEIIGLKEDSWANVNISVPETDYTLNILTPVETENFETIYDRRMIELQYSDEFKSDFSNLIIQTLSSDGTSTRIPHSIVSFSEGQWAIVGLKTVPKEDEIISIFVVLDPPPNMTISQTDHDRDYNQEQEIILDISDDNSNCGIYVDIDYVIAEMNSSQVDVETALEIIGNETEYLLQKKLPPGFSDFEVDVLLDLSVVDVSGNKLNSSLKARATELLREEPREIQDIKIVLEKMSMQNIVFHDLNISSTESLSLGIDNVPKEDVPAPDGIQWEEIYAIDPTGLNFSNATVTVTAKANALYKCWNWNFDSRECTDNDWKLLRTDLVPGQNYTITITPNDPGFGEANITIINLQSYPLVGGNWIVYFNTTGIANLTITAVNGTNWDDENETEDLRFLELRCGDVPLVHMWNNITKSVIYEDYDCDDAGVEISKVLTLGKHTLQFIFGNDTKYAYNDAQSATYDGALGAPACPGIGSPCIAPSALLISRDKIGGTSEPNQPNTLASACADGTTGTYASDESIENITITDLSGPDFVSGDTVRVNVGYYAFSADDDIFVYYTNSTSSIVWQYVGTYDIVAGGYGMSGNIDFVLNNTAGRHAVRTQILYGGGSSSCKADNYVDHDDLAFRVAGDVNGCGEITASGPYNLTTNLDNVIGNCIVISANNVVFDCLGHYIDGDDTGFDYGFYDSGYTNLTIKNCIVSDFDSNIYLSSPTNSSIINNTLNSSTDNGIFVSAYNGNILIENNTIFDNNNVNGEGIYLGGSSYINITNNNLTNNYDGIVFFSGSGTIKIDNNNISSTIHYGINGGSSTSASNITNNNFIGNNRTIYLSYAYTNIINLNNFTNCNVSVLLDNSYDNNFINNRFDNATNVSVYLESTGSYNNIFHGNNFTNSGSIPAIRTIDTDGFYNITTGGNRWDVFDEYSEGCYDANGDGFCDTSYTLYGAGTQVDFLPLTLLDPTPPIIENVTINTTFGTNLTTENITVYWNAYDANSNSINNITNWYVNSRSITLLNMPFEATGGIESTWAKDYSNYSNHGTVINAVWNRTGGYDGFGAYHFDGSGDYIDAGDDPTLRSGNDTFSISIWVKQDNITSKAGLVGHMRGGYKGWMLYQNNDGSLRFYVYNYAVDFVDSPGGDLTLGVWTHVVGTSNSTHTCIYTDGVKNCAEKGIGSMVYTTNNHLWVGAYAETDVTNTPDSYFNGSVDDVRLYNRTLSQEEITALYQNRTDIIVSQETNVGDVWQTCITPNDGVTDGTEVCSNNLTIVNPTPAGDVSVCKEITTTGSYQLTANLAGADISAIEVTNISVACIKITASNVSLDCNGYTIINDGTGDAAGIVIAGSTSVNYTNVTIKNCPLISTYEKGIQIYHSSEDIIQNVSAYDSSEYGIYLNASDRINATLSNATNSSRYGIYLENASSNNFTNSNSTNSTVGGIYFDSSSTFNDFTSNRFCSNTLDVNNLGSINTGQNDYCDSFISWTENGHNGCQFTCSLLWHRFFGDVSGDIILTDDGSEHVYNWTASSLNVYFTDSDAAIDWLQLQAIGRNTTNEASSNDFTELDATFNSSDFSDDITAEYSTDGTSSKATDTFTVFKRAIALVPVDNSTEAVTTFTTGILWDMNDGGTEYSNAVNQSTVWVVRVNSSAIDTYGTYDYLIKVPYTLATYEGSENIIAIYLELE